MRDRELAVTSGINKATSITECGRLHPRTGVRLDAMIGILLPVADSTDVAAVCL